MPQPTPPEPVNVISFTRSSSTSTSPISDADPATTFSQPGGRPASSSSEARKSADSGVVDAGLSTTGQPAASAGATLCATRLSGKLNGEIAPTIPIGSRSVSASFPAPAADASIGITSPASLRASTAANVNVDTARCASTRAAFIGLPASAEMIARRLVVPLLEQLRRPVEDPRALVRRQRRLQRRGRRHRARGASPRRRREAIRPTSSPEYGERTSVQSPVSTCWPSIRSAWSMVLAAIRKTVSTLMLRGAGGTGWRAGGVGAGVCSDDRRGRRADLARLRLRLARAGMASFAVTDFRRKFVRFVLDWSPFMGVLFIYDRLRGYADGLLVHPREVPQIKVEAALFGKPIPTVWLQNAPVARRERPSLVGLRDVVRLPDAFRRDAARRGDPLDAGRTITSRASRRWSASSR